jgi:hypothetical protein
MKDFWNYNLNGITGFGKIVPTNDKRIKEVKDNYIKKANLKGYVLSSVIMSELKVGAVRLRRMFQDIGVEARYNAGSTYYPIKHLQKIKDKLNEPKQIIEIDKTGFISNQELMQMFNFSTDKAFNIVLKEKLTKVNFGGRSNYFEREKAIETFSKYKK